MKVLNLLGKREDEWQAWLKRRTQARDAFVNFPVSDVTDAKHARESAHRRASDLCAEAAIQLGINDHRTFTPERRQRFRDHLAKEARYLESRGEAHDAQVRRKLLGQIDAAEAHIAECQNKEDQLEEDRQRLEAEMEAANNDQPKSSDKALERIDQALADIDRERKKAARARDSIHGGDDALEDARQAADIAQNALEDLAAAGAMGADNESDQRNASAALARAKSKLKKAEDDAERQAATRRGLDRKVSQLDEKYSELETLRAAVAAEHYRSEQLAAETQLLDLLRGSELKGLVERINDLESRRAAALNHGNEYPAREPDAGKLEIEINGLLRFHEERNSLQGRLSI